MTPLIKNVAKGIALVVIGIFSAAVGIGAVKRIKEIKEAKKASKAKA